jgi:hypothetical protein
MHAVAKMVRILPDGEERPVEPMMTPAAMAELLEGETVKIRLWHGHCLESEAVVSVLGGRTIVKLLSKKELRKDPPTEAIETCPS